MLVRKEQGQGQTKGTSIQIYRNSDRDGSMLVGCLARPSRDPRWDRPAVGVIRVSRLGAAEHYANCYIGKVCSLFLVWTDCSGLRPGRRGGPGQEGTRITLALLANLDGSDFSK